MPVLSDKKLEMADIGDVHALMLSQQVTSQQRTHIIRQKTVPLSKILHAILEDMLYSCFWLLRAGYELLRAKFVLLRVKIYAVI